MQEFLRGLRESGEIVVSVEPPDALDAIVEQALREHEGSFRAELVPGVPELDVDAAYWGAHKLYQACQLLTMRDAPPAVAQSTLLDSFTGSRSAASDYAVDLTFSYLPSLLHLAARVAPDDPVLDSIRELAAVWPLSSVGIEGIGAPGELAFWANRSLRRLYLDRVIETGDVSRLEDRRVAQAVRAALGAYPELAPQSL